MSVAWADFVTHVEQHLVAPYPLMIEKIRDAAIEFSEKTLLVRETLPGIDSVVDQREYAIAPSDTTNHRISTIIHADFDDRPMYPATEEHIDHVAPYNRTLGEAVYGYRLLNPTTLELTWDPSEAVIGAIVLRVANKPTVDSTVGDDMLWHDHRETISAGAVVKLLNSPGNKPWAKNVTERDRRYWEHAWMNGISDGSSQAYKGRTRGSMRLKRRRFS